MPTSNRWELAYIWLLCFQVGNHLICHLFHSPCALDRESEAQSYNQGCADGQLQRWAWMHCLAWVVCRAPRCLDVDCPWPGMSSHCTSSTQERSTQSLTLSTQSSQERPLFWDAVCCSHPFCCCSVTQLCLTLCNSMDCSIPGFPVLSPGVCTNSCPLSQWCHPAISSSVILYSSCPQSFSASESFPVSQLFTSGDQSIGASSSASVYPIFRVDFL